RERRGAGERGARVGHRHRRGRRVVDAAAGDGRGDRGPTGVVGGDGPEVVEAVGQPGGVERARVRRRRVRADVRPRVRAGRRALELYRRAVRAGVPPSAGGRGRAGQEGPRGGRRGGGRRVVDAAAGDRRGRRRPARVIGGDGPEVVQAVGQAGGGER